MKKSIKIIKSNQLTINFQSDEKSDVQEKKPIILDSLSKKSEYNSIVINLSDYSKSFEDKKNKEIINYILNNAKRF